MARACALRAPVKDGERLLPAPAAHGCLACEVRRCVTTGAGWRIGLEGATLGANSHRRQAMLSPFRRSIQLLDLALSDTERHRATDRTSFASKGSPKRVPPPYAPA